LLLFLWDPSRLWDHASRAGQATLISSIAYAAPLAALALFAVIGVAAVSFGTATGALLAVFGALAASRLP